MREAEIHILGTGSSLPPTVLGNEELCRHFPVRLEKTREGTRVERPMVPAWIEAKTGVKERRCGFDFGKSQMDPEWSDGNMALKASLAALAAADRNSNDLDLIAQVTCTPDFHPFPDPACELHGRLGANRDCEAYTLHTGCGGLVYLLNQVADRMMGGCIERALVVAAHTTASSYINPDDKEWAKLNAFNFAIFGDGACAIVLEKHDRRGRLSGILDTFCGAWSQRNPIKKLAGGSINPRARCASDDLYDLDARAVAEEAPKHFAYCFEKMAAKGHDLTNVHKVLPHQANLRIIEAVAKQQDIPMDKILTNIERYGNTSAASIGILLDEGIRSSTLKRDDLLLLCAVGAGWQYGATLVRL